MGYNIPTAAQMNKLSESKNDSSVEQRERDFIQAIFESFKKASSAGLFFVEFMLDPSENTNFVTNLMETHFTPRGYHYDIVNSSNGEDIVRFVRIEW